MIGIIGTLALAVAGLGIVPAASNPAPIVQAVNRAMGMETVQPGLPRRLIIPALNVDANVEHVGLDDNGQMDAPARWDDVGWYRLGARPGAWGNAVMAGHLDSKTDMAVFWDLKSLKPGDAVEVVDDAGKHWRFRVRATETYDENNPPPMHQIFGNAWGAHLNLITCGGEWNARTGEYDERLVVYTDLETM